MRIILFALASISVFSTTRNVTCSGSITSALQTALNSSVDGDIVDISSGSCTAGSVNWTNKNITVQGQGIGTTTVSGVSFQITVTTKATWRITGMSVGAPSNWRIDAVGRTTPISGWRIDHVAFSYGGCTQNIAIWINGLTWGLIDNSTFSGAGNAIFTSGYVENSVEVTPWPPNGNPGMGGYSWALPLDLGTANATYIETNTFTMPTGCYYGIGDSFYGGRTVFRYNTVTNAYWQNHATRAYERGGNAKCEIYNNDFNATDAAWSRAIHIRSGTGVVFNNRIRGFFNVMEVDNQRSNGQNTDPPYGACDGSSPYDQNTSGQAGWPCLDQIGRSSGSAAFPSFPTITGQTEGSQPLYVWNNGSGAGCNTGGTCTGAITMSDDGDPHVQSGRDYINNGTTAAPGYTPYTYPFPTGGATAPTVTTTSASSITTTTASSGGNVTSDGGDSVTVRGVCRSTSANPTTSDTCTSNGTGTGSFSSSLTGMSAATLYHIRAYATNSVGTSYGSDLTFTTSTAFVSGMGGKAVSGGKASFK